MSVYSLKPDPLIGIDISTTAIKMLELGRAGKQYRVESYGIEPLPEGLIVDRNISDKENAKDMVADAIARLVARVKPKAKHAAVAVAGPAVITKVITMDGGMSDTDMKAQIDADAEQYIGNPIDQVNLDFQVLGPNEKEPERADVLLAASRTEVVDARVELLEMANLKAKVIDIEKYALENALLLVAQNDPEISEGETIALIEVGATLTSINVLGGQGFVHSQEEAFGGKQLTETIQNTYGISYDEAQLAKRHEGSFSLPESYETDILQPFKEEMAAQINRMINFYYSTEAASKYGKLSHILLAGGCASIPGTADDIRNKIGGRVSVVNPFENMAISPRVSKKALMNDAPALMIACGLALRTFDEY